MDWKNDLKTACSRNGFWGIIEIQKKEELFSLIEGFRNQGEELPIEEDTLFGIASGTKFFTAVCLLKWMERKSISLETRAKELFDLQISQYDEEITIKQLLSHTSGMPDYLDEEEGVTNSLLENMNNSKLCSPKDYLPLFPKEKMKFKPGTDFSYSNGGYIYLAILIEELSQKKYHEAMNGFLRECGLEKSGVYPFHHLPRNTAYSYVEEEGELYTNFYELPIQAGGDGGLYTTKEEMLLFWKNFLKGDIISSKLVEACLYPISLVNQQTGLYYGLGLWLRKKDGKYIPFVMGEDFGVSFQSSYDRETGEYLFGVSNKNHGLWEVMEEIRQGMK